MAKLKAKQIVDIQDSIFQQTGSVQSTEADLAITGSLTARSGIVDFTNATSISGSTFSGSFVGSGAGLTGVPASGIDGQLGIFSQTGSIQATTNNIEVTGSAVFTGQVTASAARINGDLLVNNGDLIVEQYISHKNDANTRINFTDDRVQLEAGGINFFGAHKKDSAPHLFTINNGSNNIDFQIKDNSNNTLFRTDADALTVKFPDATIISGSATSTGSFGLLQGDGSELTGITSGIFQTTGSKESTSNDVDITGSLLVSASATSSTAIFTNNITNGYPTSNNWGENLEGSYFNNFDSTTHVSEILRFIAGAMSHSLDVADAAPNTKVWDSVSTSHSDGSETSKSSLLNGVLGSTYENARLSNSWTGSAFIDLSETGSYRELQDYLESKNFIVSSDRGTNNNDVGTNPFHGSYASRIPSSNITTQGTFGTFTFNISANAGGSTDVSSNSNYFGLGGLTSGGATAYTVRVISSQSFSDSYDDQTPDASSTFHTHSFIDYSTNSFGTSGDGLILSKIVTSQPAVIPSAFQDGDFNSVAGSISGRKYTGGSTTAAAISASGYYKLHDVVVGLKTGSQSDFTFKNGSDGSTRFYLYAGGLPSDITSGAPTVSVTSTLNRTTFSATSRSLSGAPYLLTTSYGYTFNSEVSKSFDPAYGYGTSVIVNSNPTNTWSSVGSTSLSNTTTTVNNSGVSSTGATNYVIDSTRTTKRSSGDDPQIHDIAVASSSFSFSLNSNIENVGQARTANNTLNYSLTFRATGRNWKNSSVTDTTSAESFYSAALFGQNSDSGSMAIYSRAQGYDPTLVTSTSEGFDGENFRIVLADNVTSFNGAYFTTDSFQTNDEGDSVLGDYDLQVKPGFLVDPGGNYGYWFASGFGSGTYKYYIRRFQDGSTRTQMTVNVGKTLVNWDSTSDGVAVGLILKSGTSAGSNTSITTCRIFDPSATTSNLIEAGISTDNHKNPFSSNIDLYGNTGGSVSSTTYTVPIRNADGMFLDSSDNELYVIIRYKGDPSPVTDITLAYS